jgi:protein-S-isoprenylcysteine O-methyltransferase Ste14
MSPVDRKLTIIRLLIGKWVTMIDKRTVSGILYRGRVLILAGSFVTAMVENSRHPVPLWSYGLKPFLSPDKAVYLSWGRHLAIFFPLLLYGVSLFIRLSATATMPKGSVWSMPAISASFVNDGLYTLLRHPLYTGSAGMILALSLMSSLQGALVLCGVGGPFLYFLAKYEEERLLLSIPDYKDYMMRTPAFCPRSLSVHSVFHASITPLRKHLGYALRSEAANVSLLAGFMSFWVKPDLKLFWAMFSIAFLLSLTAPQWIPSESR